VCVAAVVWIGSRARLAAKPVAETSG
jgi:hypothetical protein